MNRLPLLLALIGCTSSGVPDLTVPQAPVRAFTEASGPGTLHLTASTAQLTLAQSNIPSDSPLQSSWTLGPLAPNQALGEGSDRSDWLFPLPFGIGSVDTRFRPAGMTVFIDGNEQPFDMSPLAPGHTGWRVKDDGILIVLSEPHETLTISVDYSSLHTARTRLNAGVSGLSDVDYATYERTFEDVTTPGVLLPAPSTATWSIHVPAGGRFRAEPSRLSFADTGDGSDGATVTLEVTANGNTATVATRALGAPQRWWSATVDETRPWTADLSPWAGQDVELTLRTDPGGNPYQDYVFIGSPTISGQPESAPRRVIVIAVDTLRPDHLGSYGYPRATSPELDALAEQSVVFDHAWAPAPRTRPSFRSAFTGRGALEAVGAANTAEAFQAAGFATGGIVANIHLSPRFGFNAGFDHWALSSSTDAAPQVDAALAWLTEHEHEDSFLFLHLMDPHLFYNPPEPYDALFDEVVDPTLPVRFNRWKALDWVADGSLTEVRKAHIQALYDGEIAYTSSQVGRLLESLEALGPNTTVVFHTDHGEEFWEHGGFEHNHALWDEVVRTALWVRPPPSLTVDARRLSEPVANMDIGPTLLDIAGLSGPAVDGRSLLPLMTDADAGGWQRALPVAHLMYDVEQWGVVYAGHKYILHTTSGEERLYNLVTDPGELTDIAPTSELSSFRTALADAHRTDVGPGWRMAVELSGNEPLVWELPAAALDAFVIDPEAGRTSRANQVWGETPSIQASDVGVVSLSDDGKTLTLVPGHYGEGIVAVRFAGSVPAGGIGRRGQTLLTTYEGTTGWRARGPTSVVRIDPGTVILPPPSEAERMNALSDPSSADQALLEALGYVGGGL